MRSARFGLGLLCSLSGALVGDAAFSAEHPDFTGVWGNYRAPGAPPGRGGGGAGAPAILPLRPEAQAKIDEYSAFVAPAGDTPGGFCLGTGMPGSMLGSGGYPMEIVQHDDLIIVVYEAHTEIRRIYITARAKPRKISFRIATATRSVAGRATS